MTKHTAFHVLPLISCALAALLVSACSSAPSKTTLQLQDILRAERGERSTPECLAPTDLIGQPHSNLKARKFDVPIRVIFPDSVTTDDHISNRLNFKIDTSGNISQITCG